MSFIYFESCESKNKKRKQNPKDSSRAFFNLFYETNRHLTNLCENPTEVIYSKIIKKKVC